MSIPFTQYLLPDGRRQLITIDMPDDVEAKAQQIIAKGYRFEAEMLSDYDTISFTICDPSADEGGGADVACELCKNGPAVVDAVRKLVMDFQYG